ncbi:MAG TPA: polysaccharide biosynthesis protein [Acidimicrobiales bacterium]|nr:polysaccharide biosynthesis protein [Acidimicrobiales bacterium]
MSGELCGRSVLITGGTGSFGSTMARHLLGTDVEQVRILSRDEAKQDQMRHDLPDGRLRFYLGDVREPTSIEAAVAGVDYVFHAAALKQVPSCEFFPMEAVRTNVQGSNNVLLAAHRAGVRTMVCLSTDKAVYPINAMGMSKALMEKTVQAFARQHRDSQLKVCVTRYGNVMYSRGSVIPLFVRQLLAGQPVTVTDPSMTRFMMSLAESVDLVEHAFLHGGPGELFIRKAPGCTIETLVGALGNLFGIHPDIQVIGIRHGEKVAETLATREELARSRDVGQYFEIALDERDLNYAPYFEEGELNRPPVEDYTSSTTDQLDVEGTEKLLLNLPEIQQALEEAGRA